jgi:cell shape-determining protein MreC
MMDKATAYHDAWQRQIELGNKKLEELNFLRALLNAAKEENTRLKKAIRILRRAYGEELSRSAAEKEAIHEQRNVV